MIRLGLLGYPLSHSFSPAYFREKFERLGLVDARYDLFALRQIEELPRLLARHPDLLGFNVTIPYKREILNFLDACSEEAEAIGAVNVVDLRDGRLLGYNTDAYGFRAALEEQFPDFEVSSALVLGTGGAARAVCYALRQMGATYALVSRNPRREETFRQEGTGLLGYEDLSPRLMERYVLIVNTTPLGMSPHENLMPSIPYEAISSRHLLYDLIYNPAETPFLARGRRAGAKTLNGLRMLQLQAEASWRIWKKGRIFGC